MQTDLMLKMPITAIHLQKHSHKTFHTFRKKGLFTSLKLNFKFKLNADF